MSQQRGYLKTIRAKRAALWYRQPSKALHVVLVSGEAGKSTTALYLYHILRADQRAVAVFTNVASYIDDQPYPATYDQSAASLQAALAAARRAKCSHVIIELTPPINHRAIWHSIHYNSVLAITITPELTHLFDHETELVALPYAEEPLQVPLAPHQIAYFGDNPAADIALDHVTLHRGGTELELVLDHHDHDELATYLLGTPNAHNAAAAVAMAYLLGVPTTAFAEGIARLETVTGNFQRVATHSPYTLLIDSTDTSETARQVVSDLIALKKRRTLVALGRDFSLEFATEIAGLVDQVVIYGHESVDGHLVLASDRDNAVSVTLRGARRDDLVLLLGRDFTVRTSGRELEIQPLITESEA